MKKYEIHSTKYYVLEREFTTLGSVIERILSEIQGMEHTAHTDMMKVIDQFLRRRETLISMMSKELDEEMQEFNDWLK